MEEYTYIEWVKIMEDSYPSDFYNERGVMTNYEKYFGTPEKAASTINEIRSCCRWEECPDCILFEGTECHIIESIINWLQEEAK